MSATLQLPYCLDVEVDTWYHQSMALSKHRTRHVTLVLDLIGFNDDLFMQKCSERFLNNTNPVVNKYLFCN